MHTLEEINDRISNIVTDMYNRTGEIFAAIGEEALSDELDWEIQIKNKEAITLAFDLRENLLTDEDIIDTSKSAGDLWLVLNRIREQLIHVTKLAPETKIKHREKLYGFFIDVSKHIEFLDSMSDIAHPRFFAWLKDWEITNDITDFMTSNALWDSFLSKRSTGRMMTIKQFARALRFVGTEPYVGKVNGKSTRIYRGIKRKEQD